MRSSARVFSRPRSVWRRCGQQVFFVPAQLIAQLARAGARAGRVTETVAILRDLDLQGEALVAVLDQCQKENQVELLDGVLALTRCTEPLEASLPAAALETVVRAFARRSDPRAFTYWDALLAGGHAPTDAFCVQVITLLQRGAQHSPRRAPPGVDPRGRPVHG